MRPVMWQPPVEPSPAEQVVIGMVRRAKLFVFLRRHRHQLFDEAFRTELGQAYVDSIKGHPPIPPAQLALAVILQAYTGVSDDEVIEATVMDRRWQLVLDCLDCTTAPFSKGTVVAFRARLIQSGLDRRLVERTIELARISKGFGTVALRAALDSSPLWAAGRVEDTINLMGHAPRKALGVIACQQGRGLAEGIADLAVGAGAPVLAGPSLKAALRTSSSARSWGTSMNRGVWYFGATLPPRVRQVLPAGTEQVGQSNCSTAAAGSASSGMSQNLSRGALCESYFARGCESEDQGQTGHGPVRVRGLSELLISASAKRDGVHQA